VTRSTISSGSTDGAAAPGNKSPPQWASRRLRRLVGHLLAGATALGCASALRQPPPLPPNKAGGETCAALMEQAEASWARRPDKAAVRRAAALFLAAASADATRIDGLLGVVRTKAWLIEHGAEPAERASLATSAVDAGEWCESRAPKCPACHYALALALGLQARERQATANQGLKIMMEKLRQAAEEDPRLDFGGPHRVLAVLLTKAPPWPLGPGDADRAVEEAEKAVRLFPDYPPNQLALAEAFLGAGAIDKGRDASRRALEGAQRAVREGNPDARDWVRDIEKMMARARFTTG